MAAAAQADRTERNAGGSSSRSLLRGRGRTIRCDPIGGAIHWNGSECDQLARSWRDRTGDREICGLPEWRPHRDDERVIGGPSRPDHRACGPAQIARRLLPTLLCHAWWLDLLWV